MYTMRNVKFKYIPKEQCEIVGTEIEAISTKTIKGTMTIHAIVGQGSHTIFIGDVSCYCQVCIQGGQYNSWTSEITSTNNMASWRNVRRCSSGHETKTLYGAKH